MGKAVFALTPLLLMLGSAAAAQGAPWRISEVTGEVSVSEGGRSRAATRGALLSSGATVTTRARGRAVLVRGQEFVVVSPRTQLRIPEAAQARGGIIQVLADWGTALFRIERRETPHFGVQTPYLAAVVKGTTFTVNVGEAGASVQVTEGAVEVSTNDGGAMELVRPGMIVSVAASDLQQLNIEAETSRSIRSNGAPASGAAPAPAAPTSAYSGPADAPVIVSVAMPEEPVSLRDITGGLIDGSNAIQFALAEVTDAVRVEERASLDPGVGDGSAGSDTGADAGSGSSNGDSGSGADNGGGSGEGSGTDAGSGTNTGTDTGTGSDGGAGGDGGSGNQGSGSGGDAGSGNDGGTSDTGNGGDGSDDSGAGSDTGGDDDGNNGHGNDDDGDDSGNPGGSDNSGSGNNHGDGNDAGDGGSGDGGSGGDDDDISQPGSGQVGGGDDDDTGGDDDGGGSGDDDAGGDDDDGGSGDGDSGGDDDDSSQPGTGPVGGDDDDDDDGGIDICLPGDLLCIGIGGGQDDDGTGDDDGGGDDDDISQPGTGPVGGDDDDDGGIGVCVAGDLLCLGLGGDQDDDDQGPGGCLGPLCIGLPGRDD